ncbi:threonine ammonia-lyase [Clostridium luticellarii]|jgi:threonine dehydratase|uniref:L-threonine dehydratase catabolic TdcB n=1 Tax=Clostridium luticellarii TaxID=1691940 RepID=A0A2T0BJZ1_9CLOT|nr:threonine ammonia-lyase [Clostridium luticellarii]MCI1946262.1 threonine ammonia-lyase [Clostridium luticellarii]MCI1969443.1 threonine ammonia-lyase [Clostridium luticellarii]MCI1996607.1 threonine ammonia-lyase [Clostridium luticellarii]MCI2039611.1 threonine ammonia-lyase [Clostridium luticellarii]PRR84218.1 L-threonine dehydratase catabolic TdcB [Clostridium luticellarii]
MKMNLTLNDVLEARERIKGICVKTKLIYSPEFSRESGNEVYIKPENLQITGAFKLRGASNKISKLSDEQKSRGLIASSAGNHAQGVAYSARKLGIKATIVMPETTPFIKVQSTKNYGADILLKGKVYDEAYEEAKRLERENGYTFVHPFNDVDVMAGQGTIALEILDELEDVDAILVPIGGGGLISGISVAAKSINPNIKIIGVQAEGANPMKISFDTGKLTYADEVNTIADGAAVKKPGDLTFHVIKKYVDEIVTVSDQELMEAVFVVLEKHKLVAEATGVMSLAALKRLEFKGKKVVSLISGGNIDVVTMASLLNKGLFSRGRIFCFSVKLKDIPGQLLKIAQILAEKRANVIKLDHNQFKAIDRLKYVVLEVTVETNGYEHIESIVKALNDNGYDVKKVF